MKKKMIGRIRYNPVKRAPDRGVFFLRALWIIE